MAKNTMPTVELANDDLPKRTVRFALYDAHLSRAKIFRLHGRGAASSKVALIDSLSEAEIARRSNDPNPATRLRLPPPTMDVIERHDPALCQDSDGKVCLVVKSLYPVGAQEETLLLVLLSLAAKKRPDEDRQCGLISTTSPSRSLAVKAISAKGEGVLKERIVAIHVTRRRLLDELGYHGGAGYDYLKARLRRLRWIGYDATVIDGNAERAWGGSQLLSYEIVEDDPDIPIKINLNERFARVLIGAHGTRKRAPYDRIDLDERFALRSDAARLLHKRFSVDVPMQSSRRVRQKARTATYKIDALVNDLYAPAEEVLTPEAARKRRYDLKQALAEVGTLSGWVVEVGKDGVLVSRRNDVASKKETAAKPRVKRVKAAS